MELVKRRMLEPLSPQESSELESHLAGCDTCAEEARGLNQNVRSLRSLRPMATAQLVRMTQLRCRQKAYELQLRKRKLFGVVLAGIISSAWILLSIPFVWDELSSFSSGSDIFMHFTFILMWFMPAMIAGAIALWLRPQLSAEDSFHRTAISGTLGAARKQP